ISQPAFPESGMGNLLGLVSTKVRLFSIVPQSADGSSVWPLQAGPNRPRRHPVSRANGGVRPPGMKAYNRGAASPGSGLHVVWQDSQAGCRKTADALFRAYMPPAVQMSRALTPSGLVRTPWAVPGIPQRGAGRLVPVRGRSL